MAKQLIHVRAGTVTDKSAFKGIAVQWRSTINGGVVATREVCDF